MTLAVGTPYPSATYEYATPEHGGSSLYVTIAKRNGDVWVDAIVGKAGSVIIADAEAIAALAGIALRHGAPPIKVALALKGITHDQTNKLSFDVLSVADGIGDALWQELC